MHQTLHFVLKNSTKHFSGEGAQPLATRPPELFGQLATFSHPTSNLPKFPHVPLGIGGRPLGY